MERFKEEVQGFKTSEEYQTMMKRKKEIGKQLVVMSKIASNTIHTLENCLPVYL